MELLPDALVEALREYNHRHSREETIRLRMALHAGEVNYDKHGVTGASINLAFRLVDARPLKAALSASPGWSSPLGSLTRSFDKAELFRQSAELAETHGNRMRHGRALDNLAKVLAQLDRHDEACARWREALEIFTDLGASQAADITRQLQGEPDPAFLPNVDLFGRSALNFIQWEILEGTG